MTAPTLTAIPAPPDHAMHGTPAGTLQWFEVVSEGSFEGRLWRAGERIAVASAPATGHAVVLAPLGHGRVSLGRLVPGGITGSQGERCSTTRWRAVGRVVGTWQSIAGTWWPMDDAARPIVPQRPLSWRRPIAARQAA